MATKSVQGLLYPMDFRKDEVRDFVALLRTCSKNRDLCNGSRLHDAVLKRGLLEKCSDALVTMYAKCGAIVQAEELFDMHKSQDVLTWTALIAGYTQKGQSQIALKYYDLMRQEGLTPDAVTFTCILKACGSVRAADKGKEIHDEIAKRGLLVNDVMLGTTLVDMYAKCGALEKAQQVLEELPASDVVSWNALITGYTRHGDGAQALNCFECMKHKGLSPNVVTYTCILKACANVKAADMGGKIHEEINKQGLLGNSIVLGTALVDMYAKCGALAKARKVLEELPVRNVISWNALIAGYVQHGKGEEAFECFQRMQQEGLSPNAVTFTCILKACGNTGAADKGEIVHDEIAKRGLLVNDIVLGTALVDMYAKCGTLTKARQVLEELPNRNITSWNALITGYAQRDQAEEALNCLEGMWREGLSPGAVTFTCILKACGSIGAVDKGKKVHDEIVKQGLLRNNIVLGNALVDMYAKCGALARAQSVLEELPIRDAISWNALITGYAQQGEAEQALSCFEGMVRDGLFPSVVTFTCILKACGSIGATEKGERIHDEIAKQGLLRKDIVLGNALVDMYAKCGALAKARQVLGELPTRDVVSWNAVIAGYAQQCEGVQALKCFQEMRHDGLSPDAATFSCMLNACSRLSLLEGAETLFENMSTDYGMKPDLEHYTCLVDVFGRAGHLNKAVQVIEKMPCSNRVVWSALLGACQKWGDVKVGKWAFKHAVQEDESDSGLYVLMAKIYAAAGMQQDAEFIAARSLEIRAGRKAAQCSWIGSSRNAPSFLFVETEHVESNHIYRKLEDIVYRISKHGCSLCVTDSRELLVACPRL